MDRRATSKDVADDLGVRPTTVQAYARQHRIPFEITPGGHRRFNLEEVRRALAAEKHSFLAPMEEGFSLAPGPVVIRSEQAVRDARRRGILRELPDHETVDQPADLIGLIARSPKVLVAVG